MLLMCLLLHRMWFPFSSLQVVFCNRFLKSSALTLTALLISLWPLVGLLSPFPSSENQPKQRNHGPLRSAAAFRQGSPKVGKAGPGFAVLLGAWCLAPLNLAELCEVWRSLKGGSWNANVKLNNKMMSLAANQEGWCHMPGSPRAHRTRVAAPSRQLSLSHHWEPLGIKPFEVYYLRVKCT